MRRRIAIIGCSGGGKTTLSKKLETILGIQATHLDRLYWNPGWVETDKAVWRGKVQTLADRESWILDGNFGSTMDIRLERADTVVYLDMATPLCLYRVLKRWMENLGKTRPDMGEGCPERIDPAFLAWILTFRQRKGSGIHRKLQSLPAATEVIILRSRKQVRDFLARTEEEVSRGPAQRPQQPDRES